MSTRGSHARRPTTWQADPRRKARRASSFPCAVDITDKASLERARDAIIQRFGHVDVLVNNAAINDKFESPEAGAELSKFEN